MKQGREVSFEFVLFLFLFLFLCRYSVCPTKMCPDIKGHCRISPGLPWPSIAVHKILVQRFQFCANLNDSDRSVPSCKCMNCRP